MNSSTFAEVADLILADEDLNARVAGAVTSALDVIGVSSDAREVDSVMVAVMPEIADFLRSYKGPEVQE